MSALPPGQGDENDPFLYVGIALAVLLGVLVIWTVVEVLWKMGLLSWPPRIC